MWCPQSFGLETKVLELAEKGRQVMSGENIQTGIAMMMHDLLHYT